jgi:hypothetical protein
VTTLERLLNRHGASAAAVETARDNLNPPTLWPFSGAGYEPDDLPGADVHSGQQIFSLLDAGNGWQAQISAFRP